LGGQDIGVAHQFLDFVALAASLFMPKSEGGEQGLAVARLAVSTEWMPAVMTCWMPVDDKGGGSAEKSGGRGWFSRRRQ
jgi:hypothetical protein